MELKLPNYENAVIVIEKLRDYCLNEEHPRGKHKAKVFKSKLNMDSNDAEILKGIILDLIKERDAQESFSDKIW